MSVEDGDAPQLELEDEALTEQEVPNAADPTAVRRKMRKSEQTQHEAAEFWRHVLSTPIGRQEIWGLLHAAGTFEVRYAGSPNGAPDPRATDFHNGQREFGLALFHKLSAIDRVGTFTMLDEHHQTYRKPARAK